MAHVSDWRFRDPAWHTRLSIGILGIILLVPALISTEFKPWVFFESDNLKVTLKFLGDFFPPNIDPEFLNLVAVEVGEPLQLLRLELFLQWSWQFL